MYKSQSPVIIFIKLKNTSNSCCITCNLGHTGPDGVQATIISYNIYQTLKLLVTRVVLTLVTLDQMVYKSQSPVIIFIKLKNTSNSCCITCNLGHTGPDGVQATIISYNTYQTLKLLETRVVLTLVSLDQMAYKSQSSVTLSNSKAISNLCWGVFVSFPF